MKIQKSNFVAHLFDPLKQNEYWIANTRLGRAKMDFINNRLAGSAYK